MPIYISRSSKCTSISIIAMQPPINSPLHSRPRREPNSNRRVWLTGTELVFRRVPSFLRVSNFFVGRPALLPLAPFPVRPLERLPARLVLGNDVVKGLTLGGSRLADLARPDAPDDVRCEYPGFEEAAVGNC
jgi:hypothetical protein